MNIKQASDASGVSQRMIRHYERAGVIPPPARRESGHRVYDADDVARLGLAAAARSVGFDMDEIAAMLRLWLPGADPDGAAAWRDALVRKGDAIAALDRALAGVSGVAPGLD